MVAVLYFTAGLSHLSAGEVRPPVFAGRFYPAAQSDLNRTIADLVADVEKTGLAGTADLNLKALVIPHAGYIYSGFTAAHCVRSLAG